MGTTKVVRFGTVSGHEYSAYAKINYDGKNLSIVGVEGPRSNGDAYGSCGQIEKPEIGKFAPGWDQDKLDHFFDIWERWHLNDMRAGCEHQRANWDVSEKLEGYEGLASKTAGWVYEKEHPKGLLMKPCEVCGYKYGSAWLFEPVPQKVIDWLEALPETDRTPAWI